ncbi:unnamed protein product, partial [Adineta ricciae]
MNYCTDSNEYWFYNWNQSSQIVIVDGDVEQIHFSIPIPLCNACPGRTIPYSDPTGSHRIPSDPILNFIGSYRNSTDPMKS